MQLVGQLDETTLAGRHDQPNLPAPNLAETSPNNENPSVNNRCVLGFAHCKLNMEKIIPASSPMTGQPTNKM